MINPMTLEQKIRNAIPELKCKETSSFINSLNFEVYFTCNKPVKYKVEYNDGSKGNRKEKLVCGIHCNSIKKWNKKLIEKTSFNPNLVVTNI